MRFNLTEVWKNDDRRAVVVATDDEGRNGKLYFEDTDGEEWFNWSQLTQPGKWRVDTSPKPTRRAAELRAMILERIAKSPVCPSGMEVRIRGTINGQWEAESIPPPGQHIAYRDCINHIGAVARVPRCLYALDPTDD